MAGVERIKLGGSSFGKTSVFDASSFSGIGGAKKISTKNSVNSSVSGENEKQEFAGEEDLIQKIDTNGDGKISQSELNAYNSKSVAASVSDSQNENQLSASDTSNGLADFNQDGAVTQEELDQYNNQEYVDGNGVKNSGLHKMEDIDSSKWYVPDIAEFDDVYYDTQFSSILDTDKYMEWAQNNLTDNGDGTYTAPEVPWECTSGALDALNTKTKSILKNAMFENKKVKSVADKYITVTATKDDGTSFPSPTGHLQRIIHLEDGTEIKITAYAGACNVQITEYPDDFNPENPNESREIRPYNYYELGDGYYVLIPQGAIKNRGVDSESGEAVWTQDMVGIGEALYQFYDSDGNLIKYDDPKHDELLSELKSKVR